MRVPTQEDLESFKCKKFQNSLKILKIHEAQPGMDFLRMLRNIFGEVWPVSSWVAFSCIIRLTDACSHTLCIVGCWHLFCLRDSFGTWTETLAEMGLPCVQVVHTIEDRCKLWFFWRKKEINKTPFSYKGWWYHRSPWMDPDDITISL